MENGTCQATITTVEQLLQNEEKPLVSCSFWLCPDRTHTTPGPSFRPAQRIAIPSAASSRPVAAVSISDGPYHGVRLAATVEGTARVDQITLHVWVPGTMCEYDFFSCPSCVHS